MQNSLFDITADKNKNHLPYDGTVNYYGKILSKKQADFYLQRLLESAAWQHDEAIIYGKHIITKRKYALYGDKAFNYTYSRTTRTALPWTDELLTLKKLVEDASGEVFNTCLLNLYHDGNEGMAWHSDDEVILKKDGAIAALSFGAERKLAFKHKQSQHKQNQDKIELLLEHGSLLVMKDTVQTHWLHSIPTTKKITTPRVSLTFRLVVRG